MTSNELVVADNEEKSVPYPKIKKWRCLISYWILGLCNNYGYVVMLTAASDILEKNSESVETKTAETRERHCTIISTGAILLADIIPSLLVKLIAPFLPFFVHVRVALCIGLSSAGFLLVAFSDSISLSIVGVVLTSLCSGLGEVTYLQYSSFYSKNVVSTWSSGTGGAGVIGALSYSILQKIGMQTTLLIMLVVPALMGISFWIILPRPAEEDVAQALQVQKMVNEKELKDPIESLKKKFKLLPGLLKYMVPFGLVYLFEYFINQGLFELVYFENDIVETSGQYRWLQVAYQVGVFLSRSSVNVIRIRYTWILALLQLGNVAIYTTEVIYFYMPNFIVILIITIYEGLLGGAAYVNTYYNISEEVSEENKQFSMAITSFSDSIGITLAGIFAIFTHNAICDLPKPQRS